MGGSSFKEECEFTSPQTLVLVGNTGNGKSAIGNSILGTKVFRSERSAGGVTSTTELGTTILKDGGMINVIDTPGLFNSSVNTEFIRKEIASCISMARNGVHAFLLVLSVGSRFSKKEEAEISSLVTLFGRKFCDYVIVVFTGGDLIERDGQTLEDFLQDCPQTLKETLLLCGNHYILFDNKTKDQAKISDQVDKLLSLVNMVMIKNDGNPYTNELLTELKKGTKEQTDIFEALVEKKLCNEQEISVATDQMCEKQFKQLIEMVEPNLKTMTSTLERQLEEEQAAHKKAEESANAAKKKSDEQIRLMTQQLKLAQSGQEESMFRRQPPERSCVFL